MMMDKQSNLHIPCTYCDKDALPNTDPPVCEEHRDRPSLGKKASICKKHCGCGYDTLKELSSADK